MFHLKSNAMDYKSRTMKTHHCTNTQFKLRSSLWARSVSAQKKNSQNLNLHRQSSSPTATKCVCCVFFFLTYFVYLWKVIWNEHRGLQGWLHKKCCWSVISVPIVTEMLQGSDYRRSFWPSRVRLQTDCISQEVTVSAEILMLWLSMLWCL